MSAKDLVAKYANSFVEPDSVEPVKKVKSRRKIDQSDSPEGSTPKHDVHVDVGSEVEGPTNVKRRRKSLKNKFSHAKKSRQPKGVDGIQKSTTRTSVMVKSNKNVKQGNKEMTSPIRRSQLTKLRNAVVDEMKKNVPRQRQRSVLSARGRWDKKMDETAGSRGRTKKAAGMLVIDIIDTVGHN